MAQREDLTVDLGDRSYAIQIGQNIIGDPLSYEELVADKEVLVVTNEAVAEHYLERAMAGLANVSRGPRKLEKLILPDGEKYKTLETLNLIFDSLLAHRYSRGAVLVALGGGVIGDMVGFAAASYQRGVDFIQVPTTLLSQVDSSVGGKTGVNHALGKNMIGAFYQPKKVIIDIDVLTTLPERELSAGLAEVIKYGFIRDASFFEWLESNMDGLMSLNADLLAYAIKRSCEIKADVVAHDEREGGLRAILNFGHTYGHAIENHQGYGSWLHGEAVGAGMVMACDLSLRLGWIDQPAYSRGVELIKRAKLPLSPPANMSAEDFLTIMSVDKKVDQGQLRLVLLKRIGESIVTGDFDRAILNEQLSALTAS